MKTEIWQELRLQIEQGTAAGKPFVLAIDGPAASGKSTFAGWLAEHCGASVIAMDDFFLRPEQRMPERYQIPGGNIDYERFLREAAPYLRRREGFSYQRFDCASMVMGGMVEVPPASLFIVEGSYSLHPLFRSFYDIKIFLTISSDIQRERILARNGAQGLARFEERWIPLENRYFEACHVKECADYVLTGADCLAFQEF